MLRYVRHASHTDKVRVPIQVVDELGTPLLSLQPVAAKQRSNANKDILYRISRHRYLILARPQNR